MFFQALIDNMKGCFGCMFSLCRLKPPLPDVTQALQRSQFSPKTTNTHTRWVTVAAAFSAPIFWSSPAFIFPTLPVRYLCVHVQHCLMKEVSHRSHILFFFLSFIFLLPGSLSPLHGKPQLSLCLTALTSC